MVTVMRKRWKSTIKQKINTLKGEVSIFKEILRSVKIKLRKLNKIKKRYSMKNIDDLLPLQKTLQQKIQLKVQSFRRFQKRTTFYR